MSLITKTFSDVALAIKHDAFEALSGNSRDFLTGGFFETHLSDAEGLLFHTVSVKWDRHTDLRIATLYEDLYCSSSDDFSLVEGCYEHPDDISGDLGSWDQNPWGIERVTTCSVQYYL